MDTLSKQLKQIQRLRDVHLECYIAFRDFEEIAQFRAPNVVGQDEAAKNAQAIGNYRYFFNSAVRSMNYVFLMNLSRLYIGAGSLTLRKMLNTIEQNPTTVEEYRELHKDQPELLESSEEYIGMQPADFIAARQWLEDITPLVEKLQHNRNSFLVHLDIENVTQLDITYEEIFKLIDIADQILQLLTKRIDMRSESYIVVEREIKLQAKALMDLLRQEQ